MFHKKILGCSKTDGFPAAKSRFLNDLKQTASKNKVFHLDKTTMAYCTYRVFRNILHPVYTSRDYFGRFTETVQTGLLNLLGMQN
jgi:hypothetical protein